MLTWQVFLFTIVFLDLNSMAWAMEQAYPIFLDVVLCVNLTTILFYFIIYFIFCLVICIWICVFVPETCNNVNNTLDSNQCF